MIGLELDFAPSITYSKYLNPSPIWISNLVSFNWVDDSVYPGDIGSEWFFFFNKKIKFFLK
jgi:hypothetical protein